MSGGPGSGCRVAARPRCKRLGQQVPEETSIAASLEPSWRDAAHRRPRLVWLAGLTRRFSLTRGPGQCKGACMTHGCKSLGAFSVLLSLLQRVPSSNRRRESSRPDSAGLTKGHSRTGNLWIMRRVSPRTSTTRRGSSPTKSPAMIPGSASVRSRPRPSGAAKNSRTSGTGSRTLSQRRRSASSAGPCSTLRKALGPVVVLIRQAVVRPSSRLYAGSRVACVRCGRTSVGADPRSGTRGVIVFLVIADQPPLH